MGVETNTALVEAIKEWKLKRKAVILAHFYQRPEVQDIADFIGDSLQLSQQAARTDAEVIVFCGVHFMAESAAILSPDKVVLLPEEQAGCPMADMIEPEKLKRRRAELGDRVTVVCYVNSSAAVKAESDICCTSSNAVKVVESLPPEERILFVPDQNLGEYVAWRTGRSLLQWEGYCPTHHWVTVDDVLAAKNEHPAAMVLVHPECRPEVVALADGVASTSGIIELAKKLPAHEFIIGTEEGLLHQLWKQCPDKKFYLASPRLICPNMKATNLEKVLAALISLEPRITVPKEIRERAVHSLKRMLAIT